VQTLSTSMNIFLYVVYVMVKRACYLHISNSVREKQKLNVIMAKFVTLYSAIFGLVPENEGNSCCFLKLPDSNFGIVDVDNILPVFMFIFLLEILSDVSVVLVRFYHTTCNCYLRNSMDRDRSAIPLIGPAACSVRK